MNTLTAVFVIITVITLALAAYLLPTLIACARRAPDLAAVILINILLGWTAAGWIVALILAVRRTVPGIQVIGQVNGHIPLPPQTRGNGARRHLPGQAEDQRLRHVDFAGVL